MADLFLSGIVGWDITEQGVRDFLNQNDDQDLNVYINSPGGSVFEGLGVYNIIRNSGRNITTINNGITASMGSILFLAGDKRVASTGSLYMVHKPSGGVWGNADDMRDGADTLDKIQESLASIYKERANIDNINDYINEATWWNADEMIEKGVANSKRENEGEIEDMAKIDDLKAELENAKAEKKELEGKVEEAKIEAELATMKAEISSLKAQAKPEVEDVVSDTKDEAKNETKENNNSTEKDEVSDEFNDIALVIPPVKDEVTDEIDTTNTVKVETKENKIPAFMQVESKY